MVRMDASTKQGMELGEELQRKKGFDFVYVVTKDLPNTVWKSSLVLLTLTLDEMMRNLKQSCSCVPHVMLYW